MVSATVSILRTAQLCALYSPPVLNAALQNTQLMTTYGRKRVLMREMNLLQALSSGQSLLFSLQRVLRRLPLHKNVQTDKMQLQLSRSQIGDEVDELCTYVKTVKTIVVSCDCLMLCTAAASIPMCHADRQRRGLWQIMEEVR